jgi:Ca2+-binding EF-hand superfamily protein
LYSHPKGRGEYEVCLPCSLIISEISGFIVSQDIGWAKLSRKGLEWLNYPTVQQWANHQNLNIEDYQGLSISSVDQGMINKDVTSGRSDPVTFNWEIRETLFRLEKETYKEDITRLLSSFCARRRNIGYCQGMGFISVWLLIFLDVKSAFVIFCFLIEKCLPPDMYIGSNHGNALNGFYVESTVIASLLEHSNSSMKKLTMPTNEFTDFFAMQHLVQLFINTIDLPSTVFIWDQLFKEGSVSLIKGVISLVHLSNNWILKEMHPLMILKQLNNQRVSLKLQEFYKTLEEEVTPSRVERLRKKARNFRSQQWIDSQNIVIKRMQNMSGFSPDEIQELQKKFSLMVKSFTEIEPERRKASRRRSSVDLPAEIQAKMEDYRYSKTFGIKKVEFVDLLKDISSVMAEHGEIIFDTFDDDQTGFLDFRELVIALSSISIGSFEDKLQICFNAYDSEKCGFLDSIEIQLLIQRILEPYAMVVNKDPAEKEGYLKIVRIHQKMMDLSEKSNGKLSYFDLLYGIKADQFLYNCFNEFFGIEFSSQYSKIYSALSMRSGTETKIEKYADSKCRNCFIL